MSTSPLISVIVTNYNYGAYIGDCLESLLHQSYANWECLIVDNHSTDNSLEVIQSFTAKDARFSLHEKDFSAPTFSRQFALKFAKGEYIQFLDSDDLLEPLKLEKQLAYLQNETQCDIVYGSVRYFDSKNPQVYFNNLELKDAPHWMPNLSGEGDEILLPLLRNNIMVVNAPLIRKSLFTSSNLLKDESFFPEDWELWLRFAIDKARFKYLDAEGTHALVRVHSTSYSQNTYRMYLWGLQVCLRMNKELSARKYQKILVPKIAYHKKVLDRVLMQLLASDRLKAVEATNDVYAKTQSGRYAIYNAMFKKFPVWSCIALSKLIYLIHKIKNVILYA
jgi:glycosyltransferase involved in cell wall biosynthesis